MFSVPMPLPDDPVTLQQILQDAVAEIERLRLRIPELQRNRFGRRGERLDEAALERVPKPWNNRWPSRRPAWKP